MQKRWEAEYATANMRWLQEGREQLERWQIEQRRAREAWERDRHLQILHSAVRLACSADEASRTVGQAQLRHLLKSGQVADEDRPLMEATARAALGPLLDMEVDQVRVDAGLEEPVADVESLPESSEDVASA